MNIELICRSLYDEKKFRDDIKSNYLSNDDFGVCDYVANNTLDINFLSHREKRALRKHALNVSLKQFKRFGLDNYERLVRIVKNTNFITDYELHNGSVNTTFAVSSYSDEIKVLSPGYISAYHIPKRIYDVDTVMLGHEHCHALKETNYLENKNSLILGEVIPMFYELIDYEHDFLRIKYLEYRLLWLSEQKNIYLTFSDILNGNLNNDRLFFMTNNIEDTREMYEYVKNVYGCYLGSFYYALILYNVYKKDPILILSLVSDVLSHKMTTLDMLNSLNIYCDIKGEIFEEEIKNIKRILTK